MEERNNIRNMLIAFLILLSWFILVPFLIPILWSEGKIEHEGFFYFKFSIIYHEIVWLLCNMFFFILYKFEFSFFEQYKAQHIPWPWYKKESWNKLMKSTIQVMLLNHLLIIPLALLPNLLLNRSTHRLDSQFPSHYEFFYQIIFFLICEDFFFYWSHRFFHIKSIYPLFHKIHHEYQNTISVSAEYSHPLEFLLGGLLPSQAGPMLLGKKVHIMTNAMWIFLRLWKTTEAHCGYDFPISPFGAFPFSGSSKFHNTHHLHFKGNYGSFFIFWDLICGTLNKKYYSMKMEVKLPNNPYEKEKIS